MQKVIFRPEDHTYWNTVTGEQYTSVTTFLGQEVPFNQEEAVRKAKNSLHGKYRGWKEEDIIEEWDRIREEGTELHAAIQAYIEGTRIDKINPKHTVAVDWFSRGNFKGKLVSETLVWSHTLKLAGTVDIISQREENGCLIWNVFDIKTSDSLEYKLDKFSKQLWLYSFLIEEWYKEVYAEQQENLFETKELKPIKVSPLGIVHYKNYLHNRTAKPTFVPVEDKSQYVKELYKKITLTSLS